MIRGGDGKIKGRANRQRDTVLPCRLSMRGMRHRLFEHCMRRGAEIELKVGLPYFPNFIDVAAWNTWKWAGENDREHWRAILRRDGPFAPQQPMTHEEFVAYEREMGIQR